MAGLGLTLIVGCTGWIARPDVLAHQPGAREQVKIWTHGHAVQVHGVQVRGDSVRAVPFIRPPGCDSCAFFIALRDIDSVQVRHVDRDRTIVFVFVMAPLVYLAYVISQIPST